MTGSSRTGAIPDRAVLYGAGGIGGEALRLLGAAGCQVVGFLDRTGGDGRERAELPIHHPDRIPSAWIGLPVLLTVFNRDVHEPDILAGLRDRGMPDAMSFLDLHDRLSEGFGPRFWLGPRAWVRGQRPAWEAARGLWADESSRGIYDALMAMRLAGRYEDAAAPTPGDARSQYWPAEVPGWRIGSSLNLLDGGAYDGDSIASLSRDGADIASVVAFEPEAANYRALVATLARSPRVFPGGATLVPCGLMEKACQVRFSTAHGESSCVADAGDGLIQCVSIDEMLPSHRFDLVKLDVEGAEGLALQGMRRMLERCRPRLAISAYHRPGDLWELPALVERLVPGGYALHLRVHRYSGFDVVCYAVPR